MKKQRLSLLAILTVLFFAFTLGFFLGRNYNHSDIQVSVPSHLRKAPTPAAQVPVSADPTAPEIIFPININAAGETEFLALPGIGDVLAQRILTYREEHGSFGSVEELMNVEGSGEKRMEEMLDLSTTGG